ncbi:diguanylate cyclase domain protein [Clostridiales bacterium oral taxon 876 str. F0540]|nr:diguanylate cyclase domain protein [Clostridiales bacterium oral taxon 876 str. F0540]
MNINNLVGIPNFFDFIEADINKVFGKKGFFIVFNVFNLFQINEEYGNNVGDLCISGLTQSINSAISKHHNLYGFRFGENDFIIILPNCKLSNVNEIISEVQENFRKYICILKLSGIDLYKFHLEYNKNINTVEDFYEFLLKNALKVSENEESIDRIVKHFVWTFVRNIRSTSSLALKDDVSGLSNHRAGKLFLSGLIDEYAYNQKGFAVMFIDGDNLKRYNKISYEAGNQMIRNLSQIITNCIREKDKVFRWLSGDEFLVVSKGINKESSLKLAERIRKDIEEQTKKFVYPTTVSIGIAHYPSDGSSIDEVINKAEKANSYAKDAGRNMCVIWDRILKTNDLG